MWWAAHLDEIVSKLRSSNLAPMLTQSVLGDSPFDCGHSFADTDLADCAENATAICSAALHSIDIATDTHISGLMQQGILLGESAASGIFPCHFSPALVSESQRFRVILDAQYSNHPRCCPKASVEDGKDASPFKAVEKLAMNSSYSADEVMNPGIKFAYFQDIVYSFLEPTAGACTATDRCALVVEVPGAADVPWLLLQVWCPECANELGVYMISVDTTEDTSKDFVDNTFVPLIQNFLANRFISDSEVYLVAASRGCEIALLAALSYPGQFNYGIFSGKFLITEDIRQAFGRMRALVGTERQKLLALEPRA